MFVCSTKESDFRLSSPLEVFNQLSTNRCEAYAATSIGEDYFERRFDPDITYNNALLVSRGKTPTIVNVLDSLVEYGLTPTEGGDPLKAKSYEKVLGFSTTFDLIRGALAKGFPVLCGLYWQQEWLNQPDGIIDSAFQNYQFFPHAVKAFGQKNGRIEVLNSMGDVGDDGVFYFGREIKFYSPYIIKF